MADAAEMDCAGGSGGGAGSPGVVTGEYVVATGGGASPP